MWSLVVVESDIVCNATAQLINSVSGVQIYPFLLDCPPEALYPNVVLAAASSIHADLYAIRLQLLFPLLGGVLAALV